MRIIVEQRVGRPLAQQRVEIVERKGRRHPDTICDAGKRLRLTWIMPAATGGHEKG